MDLCGGRARGLRDLRLSNKRREVENTRCFWGLRGLQKIAEVVDVRWVSLINSQCSLRLWAFCWNKSWIESFNGNFNQWLSSRISWARCVVFVIVSAQTGHKQSVQGPRHGPSPCDELSSIGPRNWWSVAMWSTWVQPCEDEGGGQENSCGFSWQKCFWWKQLVSRTNLERTICAVSVPVWDRKSTSLRVVPPLLDNQVSLYVKQKWSQCPLDVHFELLGISRVRVRLWPRES